MHLALLLLLAIRVVPAPLPDVRVPQRDAALLRFVVVGDVGDGASKVARGVQALHKTEPIDAIVLTGDNVYPCGVTSMHDPRWDRLTPLSKVGVPILPVLGNHDYCGNEDAQIHATGHIAWWTMPAKQYVVRSSVADLLMIDTTPFTRRLGSEPRTAIEQAFAVTKDRWRLIVGHHTVISSGFHGYSPRSEKNRMRELVEPMRARGIDFYIGGHDHHQELIVGSERPFHLISGAGSRPIRAVMLRPSTRYPTEIGRTPIGFALVEIGRDVMKVRFYDDATKPLSEEFRFGR